MKIMTALLAICVAFILGCTEKTGPAKNNVVFALASEPKTLDPRYATDASGMRLSNLLFNSLVRLGPQLKIINDAAESHSYKDLTYSFKLRKGLEFHHGRPLSEEDIHFTFDQYRSEKSPFRSSLMVIDDVITKTIDGQIHIDIKLNKFSATFLNDLTPVKILPKDIVTKVEDDFGDNPIGTGVFKLAHRNSNEIKLERVENHPLVTPKSKYATLKIIRDDTTRILKLRNGEVDIAQNEIPLNKVESFEDLEGFNIHKFPGLSMTYLLVNLKDPQLKKDEIRKALAQAINREEIIDFKLKGLAQTASSILTPSSPFFHRAQSYSFSLDSASKLFEAVNSKPEKLTIKTSNTQSAVQNGQILANQIGKLGLDVDVQSFEWGTFYSDIQSGNFQLAMMKWVGATDPDIYRIAFHSNELPPKGRNRGSYVNPELDNLLTKGLEIEDLDKRIEHYKKVQSMVQKDLPIIPLWYDTQVAIVHERIQGYEPPLNGDYTPLIYVHKGADE